MKFSIITVCLNSAATIRDTLDSIERQSYQNVEHIVIDGASTDGTQAIVRERARRVANFLSEPDGGIYAAMNKGLQLASGNVIAFLNSDDVYADDGVLCRVARAFVQHRSDGVFGDVVFVRKTNLDKVVRHYSSARFHPSRIPAGWMPAHPALFLRAGVYGRYGMFRTDYRIAGDFEFVARVFACNDMRCTYVPEVLVKMRTGGISTRLVGKLTLNREILRACKENGIQTSALRVSSKYFEKTLDFLRARL